MESSHQLKTTLQELERRSPGPGGLLIGHWAAALATAASSALLPPGGQGSSVPACRAARHNAKGDAEGTVAVAGSINHRAREHRIEIILQIEKSWSPERGRTHRPTKPATDSSPAVSHSTSPKMTCS